VQRGKNGQREREREREGKENVYVNNIKDINA